MDCALLEKLSANLVGIMLVTDDATELANLHRAYHNLQMIISAKETFYIARQSFLKTGRLEQQQRKAKRVRRNYRTPDELAVRNL